MRPPSVYANPRCPAGCPCDLLGLLHGPHRLGLRLVLILLAHPACQPPPSLACWAAIRRRCAAGSTVTTPTAPTGLPTGHGRVGLAGVATGLASGSAGCSPSPRPGQSLGYGSGWADPPSANAPCAGGSARSPAGGGPGWSPRTTPTVTRSWPSCATPSPNFPDGAVVLAEDETHVNLLPWIRSTWIANGCRQQVTPGTNRRRTIFGAVDLHTGRFLDQVTHKAIGANFTGFCEQL